VKPSEGLTTEEAVRRLAQHGPNEIKREEATSPWVILAVQRLSSAFQFSGEKDCNAPLSTQ